MGCTWGYAGIMKKKCWKCRFLGPGLDLLIQACILTRSTHLKSGCGKATLKNLKYLCDSKKCLSPSRMEPGINSPSLHDTEHHQSGWGEGREAAWNEVNQRRNWKGCGGDPKHTQRLAPNALMAPPNTQGGNSIGKCSLG